MSPGVRADAGRRSRRPTAPATRLAGGDAVRAPETPPEDPPAGDAAPRGR